MKKPDNIFYIYVKALTEKYGMQRVTIELPDGDTMAGLALFSRKWEGGKIVKLGEAPEKPEAVETHEKEKRNEQNTGPKNAYLEEAQILRGKS